MVVWLKERGFSSTAADLLEAVRPLHTLLAQGLFVCEPLLPGQRLRKLGVLLDDPQNMDRFIADLRKEEGVP